MFVDYAIQVINGPATSNAGVIIMNRFMLTVGAGILLICTFPVNKVQAQTGTHIKGAEVTSPQTVIWFSQQSEITEIRLLIEDGKKQEAVAKARAYLERLQGISGREAEVRRHYGLCALCSALTVTGELEEAIESCGKAINLYPKNWQAFNNRGVAHYMSGQYDLALEDYTQAADMVKGSDPQTELVQHNIDLVQAKKSGTEQ